MALLAMLATGCDDDPAAPRDWAHLRVTVTDWDGMPLRSNVLVSAVYGRLEVRGATEAKGLFEVVVPPGDYVVYSSGWSQRTAAISGDTTQVRFAHAGLILKAYMPGSPDPISCTDDPCALLLTDLNGWQLSHERPAGDGLAYDRLIPGPYFVRTYSIPDDAAWGWYREAASRVEADTVWAVSGKMSVIDYRLQPGGVISGTVDLPDEPELDQHDPSISVVAMTADGAGEPVWLPALSPSSGGRLLGDQSFKVAHLRAGTYVLRLEASTRWGRSRGWYRNGWVAGDPAPIELEPGSPVPNIDWAVSGLFLQVKGPHSEDVSRYRVTTDGWPDTIWVGSDDSGTVALVPEGRHEVLPVVWNTFVNLIGDSLRSTQTRAGEMDTLRFELREGALITGAMRSPEGYPPPVWLPGREAVAAYDTLGNRVGTGRVNAAGEYIVGSLMEGDYLILAFAPGPEYAPTWYPSSLEREGAVSVHVTPPEIKEGIDVVLRTR